MHKSCVHIHSHKPWHATASYPRHTLMQIIWGWCNLQISACHTYVYTYTYPHVCNLKYTHIHAYAYTCKYTCMHVCSTNLWIKRRNKSAHAHAHAHAHAIIIHPSNAPAALKVIIPAQIHHTRLSLSADASAKHTKIHVRKRWKVLLYTYIDTCSVNKWIKIYHVCGTLFRPSRSPCKKRTLFSVWLACCCREKV